MAPDGPGGGQAALGAVPGLDESVLQIWPTNRTRRSPPCHALRLRSAAKLRGFKAIVIAQDPYLDQPSLLATLRRYVLSGGTVLLTDEALRDLAAWHIVPASAVGHSLVYAGYVTPTNSHDPLTKGARELSSQTYEPVPLGYELSNTFSSSTSVDTAPAWWVSSTAWQQAGGDSAGTTGTGQTSLGSLRLGRGQIRIIGSLLPNPSGAFTHPFGVDSYDLTYWGYQLLENALDAKSGLQRVK